jgi:hypothetical protein
VKATNKDTCPIVTAPTVTLNSANLPVITFAPGATATGGTLTAAAGASTVVYTVQPNGTVILVSGTQSFSALYTYTLTVNYSNGPSQTVAGTYTTGTAPVVVTPIGVYLFNPAILPFEPGTTVSPAIGSATWNATNPPTFETGMIITGLSNVTPKALLGKFFISPSSGAVCTTLVYKDTGLSIYTDPRTYGGCKSVPFDRVMGTPDGYIMYYPSIGRCEKVTWSIATVSFKSEEVICP